MTDEPRPAGPCSLVIFGASGDLTKRLLIPALYHLKRSRLLPEEFALIGISRAELSDEDFRAGIADSLRELTHEHIDAADWSWLASRMRYMSGDIGNPATYERLKALLRKSDVDHRTAGNHLFYLAVPATEFANIVRRLGAAGLTRQEHDQWRRFAVEKPVGTDLPSPNNPTPLLPHVPHESPITRLHPH